MRQEFTKRAILDLLPLVLVLITIYCLVPNSYDYAYHVQNNSVLYGTYPPVVNSLIGFIDFYTHSRGFALLALNLFVCVVAPYLLILHITKSYKIGWVFLYGSGIPLVMFFAWIPAQAIIHILILLSILSPQIGLPILFFFGGEIHREYLAAFFVALVFIVLKKLIEGNYVRAFCK